jgi:hypothetical protein
VSSPFAALAATGTQEGFMCSIGPGSFACGDDFYYGTEEEFPFAAARIAALAAVFIRKSPTCGRR